MKLIRLLQLFAGLVWFEATGAAAEEPRTALVMGVAEYGSREKLPSLSGVGQDIEAISATFRALGFEVTVVKNPTLVQSEQAIDEFGARLRARRGVGLYYFAGYAGQWNGTNYLLPKGAHPVKSRDLRDQALPATRILHCMEESGAPVNLVFLDCYQHPQTKSDHAGLAEMKARGVFLGFAMSNRTGARSAEGSLYTQALVDHLATPGLSIDDVHTLVTANVCSATANQTPGQYSGLSAPYYLRPAIDSKPDLMPYWTYDPNLGRWAYKDPAAEKERLNSGASFEIPPAFFCASLGWSLALNLYSRESQTNARTFERVAKQGVYAIGAHGTPDYIQDDRGQAKDGTGRRISPKVLADEIRSDPNYNPGNPITLYACSTGRGANSFAQKLADELGVPVMAPDDVLWSGAHGPDFVGPWKGNNRSVKDYAHRHGFKYFLPRP